MQERPEPRLQTDLIVRVWGMDSDGHPFFQNAHARNISSEGALLSGLEHQLTAGDTIGVQLGTVKARFRVIWVIDAGHLQKIQAGVHILTGQPCPWKDELGGAPSPEPAPAAGPAKPDGRNKRKFVRHRIKFPMEIRDERGGGAHMQTHATDIGGRGCYIETMIPLPLGTKVRLVFWIGSEKVDTTGIVRASDGGVGMGIEFVGLDDASQVRFQQYLESLDTTFSGIGAAPNQS
ncbi:MAG TPA: PilZ domain-containing protein [Terriglobales bacterium]|nr:PilZ domain-containing protein [Terriglobales bacterium]